MTPWPGLPPYPAAPDRGLEMRVAQERRRVVLWTSGIVVLVLLVVGPLIAIPLLMITKGAFLDHDEPSCPVSEAHSIERC